MDKEDMINILNQHGIDGLHSVIGDELARAFDTGYGLGYEDGHWEVDNCVNNLDAKLLS